MNPYKKLEQKQFPKRNPEVTAETRFWRNYDKPVIKTSTALISHIEFSGVAPYDCAVTSSTRVEIVDVAGACVKKTISRFKGVAYSGSFRNDSKLLVAGGAEGIVRVFDLANRSILRQFSHVFKAPVRAVRFSSDIEYILAGSDDCSLRRLSVPTEKEDCRFDGHTDYIRTALEMPSSATTWVTGSYDKTVKAWDTRTQQCVLTMDHGEPVEAVLALPTGGLLFSAGGDCIKVWDVTGGGRLLQTISGHQKAITAMALNGSANRLFTASLDQHVKVHDLRDFGTTHSFSYSAPVLAVGISADDQLLAAGLQDGSLVLRKKIMAQKTEEVKAGNKFSIIPLAPQEPGTRVEPRTGTKRYYMRGHHHVPSPEDFEAQPLGKKLKLKAYDKFLKKFQYHDALDCALASQMAPVIVTVLEELIYRRALTIAISNRDPAGLEPLLTFIVKQIDNTRYAALLTDITNLVLDRYSTVLGQSVVLDELFMRLKQKVETELSFHQQSAELTGALEMILASAAGPSVEFVASEFALDEDFPTPLKLEKD
jgi:U3 small nucleolar RNA-associated protein 15